MLEDKIAELLESLFPQDLVFYGESFIYKDVVFSKYDDKIYIKPGEYDYELVYDGEHLIKAFDNLIKKNRDLKHSHAEKMLKKLLKLN